MKRSHVGPSSDHDVRLREILGVFGDQDRSDVAEAPACAGRFPRITRSSSSTSKIWSYYLSYKPAAEADTGRHPRRTTSFSAAHSGIRPTGEGN